MKPQGIAEFEFISPPNLVRRSSRADKNETRVANWLSPWDGREAIDAGLLMVPFSKGAIGGDNGSSGGPNAIRSVLPAFTTYSSDFDVDISSLSVRDVGDIRMHVTDIPRCFQNIEEAVVEFYAAAPKSILIAIGGDHSISWPLAKGVSRAHPEKRLGLIAFDAHHDVRHLEDGPNSGTSFRAIIERLPTVNARNVVQIGISGFAGAEVYRRWCDEQGVTIITARQFRRKGVEDAMKQALAIASEGTDVIYVSFDVDVVAGPFAPGTGGLSPDGLASWDVVEAMHLLGRDPRIVALDFVCLDPLRDVREMTARMGALVVLNFLSGVVARG